MTENTTPQYTPGGSPAGTYGAPQWNPPTTPPKKQAWWKKPLVLTGAAALLLGMGIGSASAKTETVEVEKRVEVPGPERTVEKRVEVKVPVTPASCLEYVTLSEEAFDIASSAMGAIATQDIAALNGYTADLKALAPKVNAAKASCRGN